MSRLSVLFLAFWFVFPSAAFAKDGAHGPDFYAVRGVKSHDVLNIRILPDHQSDKIGEIPFNGRGIINHHCVNDVPLDVWVNLSEDEQNNIYQKRWCKIEYQGISGWVSARYLKEDSGEEGHSPIVSSSSKTPTAHKPVPQSSDLQADLRSLEKAYNIYMIFRAYRQIAIETQDQNLLGEYLFSNESMEIIEELKQIIDTNFQAEHPSYNRVQVEQRRFQNYPEQVEKLRRQFLKFTESNDAYLEAMYWDTVDQMGLYEDMKAMSRAIRANH